jgi:hypothetical protein
LKDFDRTRALKGQRAVVVAIWHPCAS